MVLVELFNLYASSSIVLHLHQVISPFGNGIFRQDKQKQNSMVIMEEFSQFVFLLMGIYQYQVVMISLFIYDILRQDNKFDLFIIIMKKFQHYSKSPINIKFSFGGQYLYFKLIQSPRIFLFFLYLNRQKREFISQSDIDLKKLFQQKGGFNLESSLELNQR
ncbi:unnamed protein product [Paramecium pentaurelia]|uniref:Transmembrane protein n=1 Tax=Paramecium pentaurelia TaxID=43138 RepID=A0A8S1TDF8_9CILI|nr:unnamed protein product [Paramecium pentaurelia]